jgi:hypothetical protein
MTNPDYRALCAELVATWDKDYPWDHVDDPDIMGALIARARAALAKPEPAPPGELYFDIEAGHVAAWRNNARAALAQFESVLTRPECFGFAMSFLGDPEEAEVRRYVEALEARSTINPVPVSERLPGPEDCDEEGRCWVFDDMLGLPSWTLIKVLGKNLEPDMTWLPHHALPMPAPANNTREENLDG